MEIGARYLGRRTKDTQFYEHHSSHQTVPGRTGFDYVSFEVAPLRRRHRSDSERSIGCRLLSPTWRKASRAEVEMLVGGPVAVFDGGTYTRQFLEAVRAGAPVSALWDPMGADALASALEVIAATKDLGGSDRAALKVIATSALEVALDRARQDADQQDPDAPVQFVPPAVCPPSAKPRATFTRDDLVRLLAVVRGLLRDASETQALLLAPARNGGWSRLRWWEAGVPEPKDEGMFGPVAKPMCSPSQPPSAEEAWAAVETAILTLLDSTDTPTPDAPPIMRPAGPFKGNPPTASLYLRGLRPVEPQDKDIELRQKRLRGYASPFEDDRRKKLEICGIDPDGHLVIVDGLAQEFWCEWPVGTTAPASPTTKVRADRLESSDHHPVFLVSPNGLVRLLPASTHPAHTHDFYWGYHGSGPGNLIAALMESGPEQQDARYEAAVTQRVTRGGTPNWTFAELAANE
jgi:hypothetical protein